MNTNKKHYSVKLKERISELEKDIYAILNDDKEIIIRYKLKYSVENMAWNGKIKIK